MDGFLKNLSKLIQSHSINFTENLILDLLKIERRWPIKYQWGQPSIEIINNFQNNITVGFFKDNGYLNYNLWKEYYDLGYTSIISNIFDLSEDLRNLHTKLKKAVGNEINANFYLSKGNSKNKPSFAAHSHPYDVIVKQLYGSAYWDVNNKKTILSKNNVLIIPKNTDHEVFLVEEPKLSLTINLL
jgi:mannose-6-phosphate isomerase-like protein (cupin superfamily)